MTEHTDELRDIFRKVADEDTVTESQEESRGSLPDEEASRERLVEIVERMRADHDFETELSDAELATVVRRFHDDDGDDEVAEALDISPEEAFRARMDLHLVREDDTDAPFDLADLRDDLDDGRSAGEIADRLGVAESTVRRYRRVVEAESEARRASERFRTEFADAVPGATGEQFTEQMAEDGLEEATEDIETDVSF